VVCVAYLFGLQVYAGSSETGQWREMSCHFLKVDAYWDWVQPGTPRVRVPGCCRV
jgi:hypothetical protein